jgi:hypothetical protein
MFEMVAPSGKMLRKGPEGQKALKYLRMNGARPLFRYLTAAGVDYLELVLEKDGRGKVRIVDLASWTMNSMATEAYRAVALSSNDKISLLNKLRAPTPVDVAHPESRELGELLGLVSEGKHVEAMQHFTAKVDALKKSEYALRLYLNASRQAGAEAFVSAVKEYEKYFPKSTTLLFMRMESYLAKKDLEKALEGHRRAGSARGRRSLPRPAAGARPRRVGRPEVGRGRLRKGRPFGNPPSRSAGGASSPTPFSRRTMGRSLPRSPNLSRT